MRHGWAGRSAASSRCARHWTTRTPCAAWSWSRPRHASSSARTGTTGSARSCSGDALAKDFRGTLDGFLALEALGSAHAQEELRSLRAQAFERGEPAARTLLEGLQLLDGLDLRDELPMLRVPSLWLSGRRDRLVPAGAMPAAAALAPGARSVVIANAGHAPFLGAADEVAREIDGFLQQLN